VGNDPVDGWQHHAVRYWCVRGPLSAIALGLSSDAAIADGAILTPLAAGFPPRATGGDGTLVIPHWTSLSAPGWPEATAMCGLELLDPRASPQCIVSRISSARLVLTESLHGAILAEAYGVPWLAFSASGNLNVAKWLDWSLSMGRDLEIAIAPAPDVRLAARHGRPKGASLARLRFGPDDMAGQIEARRGAAARGGPRKFRQAARDIAARSQTVGRLLGYTPARTAEALATLAKQEPVSPSRCVVERLQQRLVERLRDLRKEIL
jgi:succinoglycan biosynthesis protein ExoV